jgi:LAO/AO transport system kinase
MIGLRDGATLKNIPVHHNRKLTNDEQLAMNPARAARVAANSDGVDSWTPPVLRTVAAEAKGVDTVVADLDRHFAFLESTGGLVERRRSRLRERVIDVVEERVRTRLWRDAQTAQWLDEQLPALESGSTNPFAVADELLARSGTLLTRNNE